MRRFADSCDFDAVLAAVGDNCFDGLKTSSIMLVGVCSGGSVEVLAQRGVPPEILAESPVPLDIGFPLTEAMLSRTPIWIESAAGRRRWYPDLDRWGDVPPAAGLLPLEIGDEVIGGVGVFFSHDHSFNERERQHYELLADLAALATARLSAAARSSQV